MLPILRNALLTETIRRTNAARKKNTKEIGKKMCYLGRFFPFCFNPFA
jgi:hypothetical protein